MRTRRPPRGLAMRTRGGGAKGGSRLPRGRRAAAPRVRAGREPGGTSATKDNPPHRRLIPIFQRRLHAAHPDRRGIMKTPSRPRAGDGGIDPSRRAPLIRAIDPQDRTRSIQAARRKAGAAG